MMAKDDFPFKPGDRVWAYGRDSGGIEQQESVASQRRAIEDICDQYHVVLVHFFGDEARVGSSTVGRDALEDLLYMARREPRPVDGIIFWSFSRLARDQLDSQFLKADLRRRGYIVHSMTDDIPFGEFAPVVEALIDWKNERYLKDLSQDVKRGLHDLARDGYAPGGFPPRGYLAEKVQIGTKRDGSPHIVSQWVPDPELAPRVKQAFEMKRAGASYLEIHKTTRIFKSRGCYVTMFRNKTYLGIRKCGDLEVENAHEPLVSRELWDAVQATIRPRVKKGDQWPEGSSHPRRSQSQYLLSGLARCAECGSAMLGRSDNTGRRKNPFRYYLCGRKLREGWSSCPSGKIDVKGPDASVLQFVTDRVLTLDFVEALADEVNALLAQDVPALQVGIDEAQRRLMEVEKGINNLLDLAEQFGAASAAARLVEREAERNRLLAELRSLEAQQETKQLTVDPETIRQMLMEMQGTLSRPEIQPQRALLKKLVAWVKLGKEGGILAYTFPLHGAGLYTGPPRGC